MSMSIKDWCSNGQMRSDLAICLSQPAMMEALSTLKDLNMPSVIPRPQAQGLDPKDALLLDAAQRAGAQEMLNKLMSLPLLSDAMTKAFQDPAIKS